MTNSNHRVMPVTVPTPLFGAGPDATPLLSVLGAVPCLEALEQASLLLASAERIAYLAAENAQSEELFGAAYLVEMSRAVVNAALAGLRRETHD
ncbi:DUF3077 domain-containing protein [uncultured Thiodictyon sp.]|uniref:DUF3077 domain-containing protein n=1 Tax=uncultured Thiodictyon sp. TaxID=1846217 RepID=UPI0025E8A88D|nr:DUF3077 domain-containing protein [uncultured Thiodictyon sp.]